MRDILLASWKVGRGYGFGIALWTALLYSSSALGQISVSGRVVLPSGEAAQGVRLELHSAGSTYDRLAWQIGVAEDEVLRRASTDGQGGFSMASIEPGGYLLRLSAQGFLTLVARLRPLLDSVRLSEIRLTEAVRTQLLVRDAEGAAVPGARVRWLAMPATGPGRPASGPRFQKTPWTADSRWLVADDRGRVVGRRAAGGFVRMDILADGYEVLRSPTREPRFVARLSTRKAVVSTTCAS